MNSYKLGRLKALPRTRRGEVKITMLIRYTLVNSYSGASMHQSNDVYSSVL